jgi:three-Cys-motif partner protein
LGNKGEDTEDSDLDSLQLDSIGRWSVRKNDMVEYYAQVYASITANATAQFKRYYIDGFANRGLSRVRDNNEVVKGSALRLLDLPTPFDRYILVERDPERADDLRRNVGNRKNVTIVTGDANVELPGRIFAEVVYERYERALCFLDPYNMSGLRWDTMAAAGANRAIEAIIHFPTMDAHRTVLMNDRSKIRAVMAKKMTLYWGDESWIAGAYSTEGMLPLDGLSPKKRSADDIINAFRERLRTGAGFNYVSRGLPARNSAGNIVYHLLFASHNPRAKDVMRSLENRFIDRGN